jgi:2-C-methyl-D-erythritol 4-phosphate cytidylyltransferase
MSTAPPGYAALPSQPPGAASPADAARPRCVAFVPCAGIGARSGAEGPKQYVSVAGRAMVLWTLEALARVPAIAQVLVGVVPGDRTIESLIEHEAPARRSAFANDARLTVAPCGGATRADTVANGLAVLAAAGVHDDDWVLVHDAARCLVDPDAITRLIDACRDDAVGGLLALPVADTLKHADANDRVDATLERDFKWAAQTPQMFRMGLLRRALESAARNGMAVTDEAGAVEALGLAPRLVRGSLENFKITWPEDFALAERLLRGRMAPTHDRSLDTDDHDDEVRPA